MRTITALLFLTFCLPIGIAQAVNPPAPATHKRGIGTAPLATDAAISASIKERLARSKIGKNGFRYKVSGGIVTWEGKADVVQHKGSATRMARAAGARAVVNNIQISDAARAKSAANLEKGRRRAQVVRSEPRTTASK